MGTEEGEREVGRAKEKSDGSEKERERAKGDTKAVKE